jgi:hypothetical protein
MGYWTHERSRGPEWLEMGECYERLMIARPDTRRLTVAQIFIIEGILTVVLAVAAYWYVMDWPAKATFVTPEEKELVTARLAVDSDAVADESVSVKNVMAAMKDPKVWLYGACFHTLSLPLYTLSMFLVRFDLSLGNADVFTDLYP